MKETFYRSSFTREYQNFHLSKRDEPTRQCVRRSPKESGGMLKTNYESNACLLLETDLRWLLWRLGLLRGALKSGLWPVMARGLARNLMYYY